jgi:predicted membrane protein
MEIQDLNTKRENMWEQWEADHKRGKRIGGLFVVIIGALFLGRELGADIPHWVFTWKTLLIGIGLFIAVKHRFRRWGWIFPVIIGGAFLTVDLFPTLTIKPLLWPILIILAGLIMIFKPRRKFGHRRWKKWQRHHHRYNDYYKDCDGRPYQESSSDSDRLDFSVVFGNIKRNVLSKNFQGGEMNIVMGGGELNLSQADINGTANIEINTVLGGAKLVVPPNWTVKSELNSVMGSIEDKRHMNSGVTADPNKILVLEGNVCMGGIDITSY